MQPWKCNRCGTENGSLRCSKCGIHTITRNPVLSKYARSKAKSFGTRMTLSPS